MTKVLYTLETMESGGVEKRRLLIIKNLIRQGYKFEMLCTYKKDNELTKEIESYGVKINVLNQSFLPWNLRTLYKVIKIIKNFRPDIIHGGVFEGCAMASIAGSLAGVPIRIIEETSDPGNRKKRADYLMRLYGKLATKAIGISPAAYEYLIKRAKIPKAKIRLINNGVSLPRIVSEKEKFDLKSQLNLSSNDFIIGTVGRMINDNEKRFSDLIKVTKVLVDKNIPVKLLMIGDGPDLKEYKNLSINLGIEDRVILAGYKYDVDLYYQIMDLFTLVSSNEGFGLVVAEAMLNKLPVVATNIGGLKSIVINNETGFLVAVGDLEKMSECFEEIYGNSMLRDKFGCRGYERAMKHYSETVYTDQIKNLYQESLRK